MTVYLAARYPRRKELKSLVPLLREKNITVRSRWLDETLPLDASLNDVSPATSWKFAAIDLDDIEASDTFVLFSEDPNIGYPRGGRHFETGFALSKGKRVIVIGPAENVFHFLPEVIHYSTVEDFLEGEAIPNETTVDAN